MIEEWKIQTIKDLRSWNCNKLADKLESEWNPHEHFIEAIAQKSDNTMLYGCADCAFQFEEVVEGEEE